jgi:Lrp/AsnC family transcriptional regulator
MDRIDLRILTELQRDATLPIARLADRVGLSQTPCWKRVQKLEQSGVILGRVAIVDPAKVGLGLTVLAEVVAQDHTAEWRDKFVGVVSNLPEVMEVLRLGGAADYILRVVVPDIATYDRFYQTLTNAIPIRSLTSKFVMERVHMKPALPLSLQPVSMSA